MKISNTILLIVGLYGMYYITNKMMFAEKLKFEIDDIALDFSKIIPVVLLRVKAINPTRNEATINDFNADVYINDFIKIGNIKMFSEIKILPLQESFINFEIKPDYKNIINYIKNIIDNKKGYLTIKGNVTVDSLTIPLNLKYNVG
jgi:LEA14-like dessication related protein